MIECDYCGEEFESEDTYREHLQLRHDETPATDANGTSWLDRENALYVGVPFVAVALILAIGAGFVAFGGDDTSTNATGLEGCPAAETQPHDLGSVHYHGTVSVYVGGDKHELTKLKYYLEDEAWHLEDSNSQGDDATWHAHARNVTLRYALSSLPGFCAPNASTVGINGTWYYGDEPGTTVRYLVNGEEVDPQSYIFEAGDEIRVVAKSENSD